MEPNRLVVGQSRGFLSITGPATHNFRRLDCQTTSEMLVVKISTFYCFSSLLFIFCFRCQFTANMLNSMSTHYKIKHPEAENPDYVERSTDSQNFSQEFWKEEWGIPTLQVCDGIERLSCAQEHFCKTREHDLQRPGTVVKHALRNYEGVGSTSAGCWAFSLFYLPIQFVCP